MDSFDELQKMDETVYFAKGKATSNRLLVVSPLIVNELCEWFEEIVDVLMKEEEAKYFNIQSFIDNMAELKTSVNNYRKETFEYVSDEPNDQWVLQFNPRIENIDINHQIEGNIKDNELLPTIINHQLMREALSMFTNHSFSNTPALMAISKGYRDSIAERVIGDCREEQPYLEEKAIAKLLTIMVGPEKMAESYFTNKPEIMYQALGITADHPVLSMIGDNFINRDLRGQSTFGEIQVLLTDIYFENPDHTKEEIDLFINNLYSNPAMFGNKEAMYQSMHQVKDNLLKYNQRKTI